MEHLKQSKRWLEFFKSARNENRTYAITPAELRQLVDFLEANDDLLTIGADRDMQRKPVSFVNQLFEKGWLPRELE